MKTHLRCDGILQGYSTWVHHGEDYASTTLQFAQVPDENRNLQTSDIPRTGALQDGHERLDDMQGLLEAAFVMAESNEYESISSMCDGEQDGFTSEFGNMENNNSEFTDPICQEDVRAEEQDTFATFMKDANTKLYSGCETFSRLSFLVTLYHQKVFAWMDTRIFYIITMCAIRCISS